MRTRVTYEWVCETLTETPSEANGFDPDILDCNFWGTYREASAWGHAYDGPWRVALVRIEGNECEGLTWRGYAYVDDAMRLAASFETCDGAQDGPDVPARFQAEIDKHHAEVD